MGRVDCFDLAGIECWFNSEDHLPQHIHVKKVANWEIRVYFLTCTHGHLDFDVKWQATQRGPSSKECKVILEAVPQYRVELLDEWTRKVQGVQNDY